MYIPRRNLDSRFNSHVKFLEKKYNVAILFECVGNAFIAEVMNLANYEDFKQYTIGDKESTKEHLFVNLARTLKANYTAVL